MNIIVRNLETGRTIEGKPSDMFHVLSALRMSIMEDLERENPIRWEVVKASKKNKKVILEFIKQTVEGNRNYGY